ncbi:unnamed protein product [Polarella glacialis]|uniref:Uncharacterized protein n=1 Tax=Polarella glacialis TaxID=89957 RepID=A0A813GKX2_POLGL|nr:unnamed protein product [Polarella glacialis]
MPWLIMEPLLQGKVNKEPPALMSVPQGCNDHGQVFHGMRKMPAAMIDMFKLGYDADVVEVRLREYADIVDLVVIVEAESSFWGVPKLSMWDRLRAQSRFTPFSDKLLHLVFTWADIHGNGTSKVVRKREKQWTTEGGENNMIPEVLRHLKLNSDSIVLNFGDADEVTSRNNMHLMKHCEPKKLPVDSGIWFPMGRVDRAFKTDWPTGGFQYTLGDPTYQPPSHFVGLGHGKSGPYLLGGMHMTDYNYLPFRVMKVLSNSDSGGVPQAWSNLLTLGNVSKLFFAFSNMEAPVFPAEWRTRIIPLGELFKKSLAYKDMVYVPWFLAANEARFPAWFGKEDPRVFSKVRRST